MACSSPACKSGGCYNEEEDRNDDVSLSEKKMEASNGTPLSQTEPIARQSICVKCKLKDAVAGGAGGGEDGRFCAECFRGSLFGKFRFAVTSNGMIDPSDKVLVAFSGGTSSRVALQFVHDMQQKARKNFEASRDKSISVFGVGVAYIDENSSLGGVCRDDSSHAIEQMKLIISELSPPEKDFHVAPIKAVYSTNVNNDGRDRLKELLNATTDVTGREDLLVQMRMLCLQKIAIENGYNKLVLGSCTSRIARHVLSATVKGQGYSLSADIQYVDARWEVPVLLPLRDCLVQELNTLCQLDGLNIIDTGKGRSSGINALVSSFVALLQVENPSRECTIVRTAGKLTPFSFNKLPDSADDVKAQLASQRRQKKFNLNWDESLPPETFCSLCNSPISKPDLPSLATSTNEELFCDRFRSTCCLSCRSQILPEDSSALENYYSLLPELVTSRAKGRGLSEVNGVMEKIQDFLLSDGED